MNRAQLLKHLDEAWKTLNESYAGLSDSQMQEPGVIGNWAIKDIIVHVSSWEQECLKHLPLILKGGRPPRYSVTYGGIDAFNALVTEGKRNLSLPEVLRERDDTHRRLVAFIEKLPAELFAIETRVRRRIKLDTYGHYPKHSEAIAEWRGQKRSIR
jgi:hypothetical protein